MVKSLIKKALSAKRNQIDAAFIKGKEASLKEEANRKFEATLFIANTFTDKNIIHITNQWDDPKFGKVLATEIISGCVFLQVKDTFTGEIWNATPNSVYLADRELVEGILLLNPVQRWMLSAHKGHSLPYSQRPYRNKKLSDPKMLFQMLEIANFFD